MQKKSRLRAFNFLIFLLTFPSFAAPAIDAYWPLVRKYMNALQSKDLQTVKDLSLRSPCRDKADCEMMMNFSSQLAGRLRTLRKDDFVNIWEDSKQAILSTKPLKVKNATSIDFKQSFIYFAKEMGGPKIVTILDEKIKGRPLATTNPNEKALEDSLLASFKDSDQDGLTDEEEKCEGARAHSKACVKTNPDKRDTNGDGWWDGMNAQLKS